MSYSITLIPGDGIGPELADAAVTVLEATGIAFEWQRAEAGEAQMASHGTPLPDSVLDSIRRTGVAIKGPITMPVGEGLRSVNVTLRQALDLYANLRPARSIRGIPSRYEDIDLVIVRENTGDIVSDLAAGLVGGLGVAPGANIGTHAADFEPVHGSAPKYAGQDVANATALILSAALMLRHLGETATAERVEGAVREVIGEGHHLPRDLGGTTGTRDLASVVAERVGAVQVAG